MTEKQIRYLLVEELKRDWAVDNIAIFAPARVRYFQTDIFGVFDVIAIHPRTKIIYFIQITSKQHRSERFRKIIEWLKKYELFNFSNGWLYCYDSIKKKFSKELVKL